jgi:hypothetical protein
MRTVILSIVLCLLASSSFAAPTLSTELAGKGLNDSPITAYLIGVSVNGKRDSAGWIGLAHVSNPTDPEVEDPTGLLAPLDAQ